MIKFIAHISIFFLLLIHDSFFVYAEIINYNIADFISTSFNNGLPVNTGNKAGVKVYKEVTFSGSIQVSDTSYNMADFISNGFNNGLPVNTGKRAKVKVDKSILISSGQSLTSDTSYNIADFSSSSFNNGLPVNTGKRAKVVIDNNKLSNQSGSYIYGDLSYNIADFSSSSFNNGLPVNTGKKAKVLVSKVVYESGVLVVNLDSNYNIADFTSNSFNNGLPVNTGKKAKVTLEKNTEYYSDQKLNTTKSSDSVVGDITYTDTFNDITSGFGKDYTNSLTYIFQAMYKNNKSVNIKNIAGNLYNNTGDKNTIVVGDKGLFQLAIHNLPTNNEKLSYDKNNEFVITDGEFYKTETSILQIFLTGGAVVPPVLTYPYKETIGTGTTALEGYYLKTNYPTIKGMAYPNSILEVKIGVEKYYVKVDNYGLFEFNPTKKIDNGSVEISFQYIMLENSNNFSSLANKKLLVPKKYTIKITGNDLYEFPYITNMYNDDYLYSNIFYMEGFANPGDLNYKLTKLDGILIKEGVTIVDATTKKFSFLLGDKSVKLTNGEKYIIEVWQGDGMKERKSFTVFSNNTESINILNIKDFEILPTLKPTFIGNSKETTINNDTVRIYACDITDTIGLVKPCLNDSREFLGTVSADSNGLFVFTPLSPLKDKTYYEIEFIHTKDLKSYKKLIIKTDINTSANIFNSKVTSIVSGVNVGKNLLNIEGYTLPFVNITINTENTTSDKNGNFNKKIYLNTDVVDISFSTGALNYNLKYKVIKSDKNINNIEGNYYQNYNTNDQKIIYFK